MILRRAKCDLVAFAIEGARAVFETKAQLRSKATAKAVAKAEDQGRREGEKRGRREGEERGRREGEERGRRESEDRILDILRRHDVELGPEAEKEIFGKNGRDD